MWRQLLRRIWVIANRWIFRYWRMNIVNKCESFMAKWRSQWDFLRISEGLPIEWNNVQSGGDVHPAKLSIWPLWGHCFEVTRRKIHFSVQRPNFHSLMSGRDVKAVCCLWNAQHLRQHLIPTRYDVREIKAALTYVHSWPYCEFILRKMLDLMITTKEIKSGLLI